MFFLLACAVAPEGLRLTPEGDGPVVVVDWDAKPLPEIPFPNDLATRVDPTSPTGLRVNISEVAPTITEEEARQKLNEMTGFGVYAPITVAFDQKLDLDNILSRHPDDFERGAAAFEDDAIFVVNVDPESPDFGKPVALDLGHGRFVYETEKTGQYYANDTRAASPSLVFETMSEDLDGDGVLDWGEDTDNDGWLDVPNVWPEGGDPRADLLTFYELQSNTLILRPVVPLREESRYAVVLTSRLVGDNGGAVKSPWKYVNHTRQTDALEPVVDALSEYGVGLDDIAYAWVFSTGRVTGDLVDIRRGLDGEGPFARLATEYPARVNEALALHDIEGIDPRVLPPDALLDTLVDVGLFDGASGAFISAAYREYSGAVVGGSFETPYFLADRDDGDVLGGDADEWWQIDAMTGTYNAKPARIPFTCVLPKEGEAPYDVAIFGHGHGSSRFDMLLFGWSFNRLGIAACAIDWPGHGADLAADEEALIRAYLAGAGLEPFLDHLQDSRYRDLNNDGRGDSGADQWITDPFHTRDMVRQGVVDWVQFVKALQDCGQGDMEIREVDGSSGGAGTTCDWNGDGQADLGGKDASFTILGGSLGGINTAVAAAVMPEVDAFSPIVPGGGLLDVAVRSDLGGVISAVVGRMISPMLLGMPDGAGGIEIVQLVNAYGDMHSVHVASLASFPAGGRVEIEVVRPERTDTYEGYIPADGSFRLPFAADAPDAFEKRAIVDMPETGPVAGAVYSSDNNVDLGDYLVIRLFDAEGDLVEEIDTFDTSVVYEGVTMPAGSPVVAAAHGSGKIRGTKELRRLAMVMAMALEPADPVVYARHWVDEPFEALGGEPSNVLLVPTIGDQGVTISSGLALARAAVLVDWQQVDDRYDMTPDQWLISREVARAVEDYGPYTDVNGAPCLFDPDDLDEGTDGTGAPSEAPLRATRETSSGITALRLPYPQTTGKHGFSEPDPSRAFDVALFVVNQTSFYFASGGTELRDEVCLGSDSCADIPPVEWEVE
ncbi:MAG: hypothetical protein FJ102_07645 [Deltaproteobacteria bacterium]|nr:hypothetical protein [Deltaproteobacteria bacterium]